MLFLYILADPDPLCGYGFSSGLGAGQHCDTLGNSHDGQSIKEEPATENDHKTYLLQISSSSSNFPASH